MDDDGITHHGVGGCYTEAIDEIRKLIAANKDRGIDFSRCK
jgi:hypothetical protein